MKFPRIILVEPKAHEKVLDTLTELDLGKKCAVFCGANAKDVVREVAKKSIDNVRKKFKVELFDAESIETDYIKKTAGKIKKFDFVVAIGGGKTIDVAKCSAFLAKKPWIAIPTVPSHDGMICYRAILSENEKWTSVDADIPTAVIVDLDVIKDAPYRFIAAGAGDALSNVSSVLDWKLAAKKKNEQYDPIIADIALIAPKAVSEYSKFIKNKTYEGLDALVWALIWSGMSVNISRNPRVYSGSEHNFSHALDALGSKALHGEQVALGTIISVYLHGGNWKGIMKLMYDLGLPTSAKSIGISEDIMIKALVQARDMRNRYTILNEKNIDEKEARKILKKVGII